MDKRFFVADAAFPRLDVCLASLTEFTRSRIKKLIDEGMVHLNGKPAKPKDPVAVGDGVELFLPEPETIDVRPENIPVDIVYEDECLAVVNKPQGMTVHAGSGVNSGTLVNALLYRLDSLSGINGKIRPGIVHRIDKDTSGLLVVAKNDAAHLSLSRQIAQKTCRREYLALLVGRVGKDEGVIETYIDRSKKNRTEMCVSPDGQGRKAITEFTVVRRYADYTLCRFRLQTGRTHQIRVHAKYMGHPVVGDRTYGPKTCRFDLKGQLLHACRLELTQPVTGERMTFTAPLPDYFVNVLKKIGERDFSFEI